MRIAIAADHNGFELKNNIKSQLEEMGHEVEDVGPHHHDPQDDYPDYAKLLSENISE